MFECIDGFDVGNLTIVGPRVKNNLQLSHKALLYCSSVLITKTSTTPFHFTGNEEPSEGVETQNDFPWKDNELGSAIKLLGKAVSTTSVLPLLLLALVRVLGMH